MNVRVGDEYDRLARNRVLHPGPHLPIGSIRFAPIKCGLMTTSALSSAALLRLYPACPDEDLIRQERMPYK
jgi:hypothetical protein